MQYASLFTSRLHSVCLRVNPITVIQSVSVASYQAEFVHYDSVANLNISNPQDCHTYPELKRKIYSALADGDEGELSIAIPKEVPIRLVGNSSVGPVLSESAFLLIHFKL